LLYVTGLRSDPAGNGAYVLRYGRQAHDMPVWQQRRNPSFWIFSDRYGHWAIDDGDVESENFEKDHDRCKAYHLQKHKRELLPTDLPDGKGAWHARYDKKLQVVSDIRIYTTADHIAEGSEVVVVHPEYSGRVGHVKKIDSYGVHIVGLPPLHLDDVIPGLHVADRPTIRRASTAPMHFTEEEIQELRRRAGMDWPPLLTDIDEEGIEGSSGKPSPEATTTDSLKPVERHSRRLRSDGGVLRQRPVDAVQR
jgi:hypothetical protein